MGRVDCLLRGLRGRGGHPDRRVALVAAVDGEVDEAEDLPVAETVLRGFQRQRGAEGHGPVALPQDETAEQQILVDHLQGLAQGPDPTFGRSEIEQAVELEGVLRFEPADPHLVGPPHTLRGQFRTVLVEGFDAPALAARDLGPRLPPGR